MNIHPPESRNDPDDETLPCGRLLSQVWAAWEDSVRDEHAALCPHCRAAVADLEHLENQVKALDSGSGQQPFDAHRIIDRVMDMVRLELRPGHPLPLGDAADDMVIMENIAARVLRGAAEEIPGVRAGSCRMTPANASVKVALSVQAPLTTHDVQSLAHDIRLRVRQAADQRLGLQLGAVDVLVTDLVPHEVTRQEGDTSE
ncbi:Asp23/Gls24 family envelope stress response protein [Streptomyces microflavus]|uniref:Asp23/Gls24 family envelope stress response protein n=1 Tax=Streptomyces microflavus TaxID=1919 RepID=UPI00365844E7